MQTASYEPPIDFLIAELVQYKEKPRIGILDDVFKKHTTETNGNVLWFIKHIA